MTFSMGSNTVQQVQLFTKKCNLCIMANTVYKDNIFVLFSMIVSIQENFVPSIILLRIVAAIISIKVGIAK